MPKIILVTGITGQSGKWFLKKIISEHQYFKNIIFRFVIRNPSKKIEVTNCNFYVENYFGDVENYSFVEECTKNVTTILHLAGIGKSLNIINAAVKNKVDWVILVHTAGIYSKYKSACSFYIDIENEINQILNKNKETSLTILRPTMIYGSITDANICVFIKMIHYLKIFPVIEGGKYLMQPVYDKDLAEAYFGIIKNESVTKNKNYNLSGKEPILLIDILKIIKKHLNKKNIFISVPFPLAYFIASIFYYITFCRVDFREKIQRMVEDRHCSHEESVKDFGYNPVNFEEGLLDEINTYKKLKNIGN